MSDNRARSLDPTAMSRAIGRGWTCAYEKDAREYVTLRFCIHGREAHVLVFTPDRANEALRTFTRITADQLDVVFESKPKKRR